MVLSENDLNSICRGYAAMALAGQDDLTDKQRHEIFHNLEYFGFDVKTVPQALQIGQEMGLVYDEDIAKKYLW